MSDDPTAGRDGPAGTLLIEPFALGPFETNCHVVRVAGDPGCLIVDAGFDPGEMIGHVEQHGLSPELLILTHAHADHIAGIRQVRGRFPELPILIHDEEREWLVDPELNLSAGMGFPVTAPAATGTLADGDEVTIGGHVFTVLHTPGHSPGGITLYCADAHAAIVGDSLFNGSIGRTDFPGSDFETLAGSIRTKLYALPDETIVYPGHGPRTTIGREKRSNPFVRPVG
jgi:glyoxylase-like metal-dependent hydrolase (beta-lactamase superfamily II)